MFLQTVTDHGPHTGVEDHHLQDEGKVQSFMHRLGFSFFKSGITFPTAQFPTTLCLLIVYLKNTLCICKKKKKKFNIIVICMH